MDIIFRGAGYLYSVVMVTELLLGDEFSPSYLGQTVKDTS